MTLIRESLSGRTWSAKALEFCKLRMFPPKRQEHGIFSKGLSAGKRHMRSDFQGWLWTQPVEKDLDFTPGMMDRPWKDSEKASA